MSKLRTNASLASLAQYVRGKEQTAWRDFKRSQDYAATTLLSFDERCRMERQGERWHELREIADHLDRLSNRKPNPDKE